MAGRRELQSPDLWTTGLPITATVEFALPVTVSLHTLTTQWQPFATHENVTTVTPGVPDHLARIKFH